MYGGDASKIRRAFFRCALLRLALSGPASRSRILARFMEHAGPPCITVDHAKAEKPGGAASGRIHRQASVRKHNRALQELRLGRHDSFQSTIALRSRLRRGDA